MRRRRRRRKNPSAPIGALAVAGTSFAGLVLGYMVGGLGVAEGTPMGDRLQRTQPYASIGALLGAAGGYLLMR